MTEGQKQFSDSLGGVKYLGSVTVYSHLQACGMNNDHMEGCFRYQEVMEGRQVVRKRKDKES